LFLARRLILILVALVTLAGSTAYLAAQSPVVGAAPLARAVIWCLFILLTFLCVLWVGCIWHRYRQTIRGIRHQLRQFECDDLIGMIMVDVNDELAGLVLEINQYLTNLKRTQENKWRRQKELQLQANVAETERRQAEAVIISISEAVLVTDRYDELLTAKTSWTSLFRAPIANP